MQFDTKIAVVIRTDLEPGRSSTVASFLAGGYRRQLPECIGEIMRTVPAQISVADRPADPDLWRRPAALSRALERAFRAT